MCECGPDCVRARLYLSVGAAVHLVVVVAPVSVAVYLPLCMC